MQLELEAKVAQLDHVAGQIQKEKQKQAALAKQRSETSQSDTLVKQLQDDNVQLKLQVGRRETESELSGKELAGVREDIKLAQKKQLEMKRDINKTTLRTRETGLEIMNLKNVLKQREAELAQFTQSVCDTGH